MFEELLKLLDAKTFIQKYQILEKWEDSERGVYFIKIKAEVVDGTHINISRRRTPDEDIYTCFWSRHDVTEGWNNFPHHKDVKSYPDHHHIIPSHSDTGRITATSVRDVESALDEIEKMLRKTGRTKTK